MARSLLWFSALKHQYMPIYHLVNPKDDFLSFFFLKKKQQQKKKKKKLTLFLFMKLALFIFSNSINSNKLLF